VKTSTVRLVDLKLENVSVLDLVTIRADVVDDLP